MENEEAVEALARIIADHLDKGSKHQLKPAKNDYALARVIIEKGYRVWTRPDHPVQSPAEEWQAMRLMYGPYAGMHGEDGHRLYETRVGTAPEQSCPTRLMDGRNEIRCWLTAGHEGDCK